MPRRPKEDTGEVLHAASAPARTGDNSGYDGEAMMRFITQIEAEREKIDEITAEAKQAALPHREEIERIKKEAAESGLAKTEFSAVLRLRRKLKEIQGNDATLDEDQRSNYDRMVDALKAIGQLAGTPLGDAAMAAA